MIAGSCSDSRLLVAKGSAITRITPQVSEQSTAKVKPPLSMRDHAFESVPEDFTDGPLATLTLAVAMYDALARFSVALEV